MQATHTRDAQLNDAVVMDITTDQLPYFIRPEDLETRERTMTCPKCGQRMTLSSIPLIIREKYSLPEEITVVFIEYDDDIPDTVYYDGVEIDLWDIGYEAMKHRSLVGAIMLDVISEEERDQMLETIRQERQDGDLTLSIDMLPEDVIDSERVAA